MTLGYKIQEIRTARGMSQEQFGELLGTTRQTVSKWELDQVVPDIKKIIAISRMFCVSTDELLLEVSNFKDVGKRFVCGVYRDEMSEIVETENYVLFYYSIGKTAMGAKLYSGNGDRKKLIAVCEKDCQTDEIKYAWTRFDAYGGEAEKRANDPEIKKVLGEEFDRKRLVKMRQTETFFINHGEYSNHTVSEYGIKKCLEEWRNGDGFTKFNDGFSFSLFIGKNEFIFSLHETDDDIYCGCSYNVPFDLGIRSYGQYYRLRNYGDNSKPWCSCFYDFAYAAPEEVRSVDNIELGCSVFDEYKRFVWFVKRYNDNEIVLAGCNDEEYRYNKNNTYNERFVKEV